MKYTNRAGLPEPLVAAVINDDYDRGDADITVTELIDPPRKVALTRKHRDEIEEDVSDRIWSLLGQVTHGILARAGKDGLREKRYVAHINGWKVSGQVDRLVLSGGLLQDYKVSTAWAFKGLVAKPEHEAQLNCYAALLRENGVAVGRAEIVGILRDWSKLEAARDPLYPQSQVKIMEVNLWPPGKALEFLKERVRLHQAAREKLPYCTPEEQWAKPNTWAYYQNENNSRATKIYDDEALAHQAVKDRGGVVRFRPGELTRCRHYCPAAAFCDQVRLTFKESSDAQEGIA